MMQGSAARWLDLAILVFVNFLFAAEFPAYKIASETMDSAAMNVWALFFAFILLLPMLWWERKKRPMRAPGRKTARSVLDFALLGLLGILPSSSWLAWGIARSTSANASILSLTIPVLMVVMGIVFVGERFTLLRGMSLLLALVGTALLSIEDITHASFAGKLLVGNIVIFLSGAGSAFCNSYGKVLLARFSEIEVLVYSYVFGIAGCAVWSAFDPRPFYLASGYPLRAWVSVAILGAFPWGIAMVLFLRDWR
jgi:drug/metabolite transporter (DMT)-like permease